MNNTVVIVPCKSYEPSECQRALSAVLEPLGGLDWVQPGMNVVIKANLVSFLRPETAAVTHPALVRELCKMLIGRGASVVVGDSPGGLYNAVYVKRVYAATGIGCVTDTGARLNDDFGEEDVEFPEAVCAKKFRTTSYLLKADAIIDFCKLKTHGLMAYTGACKNFFGAIPGTVKPEYHYLYPDYERFANMLVDLCEYFKPRLCITDAVEGMEGNGPSNGTPRMIGALLASTNAHALDLCGAHIIGLKPGDVPTLEAAIRRGLVAPELSELNVVGDIESFKVPDYKLIAKHDVTRWGILNPLAAPVLRVLFENRPKADGGCTGCGKCASLCPAKAITIKKKRPEIDRSLCIRCFCCQEFCPTGAMKVTRPPVARFLNR